MDKDVIFAQAVREDAFGYVLGDHEPVWELRVALQDVEVRKIMEAISIPESSPNRLVTMLDQPVRTPELV